MSDKKLTVVSSTMNLTGDVEDTFVGADYTLYDTSGGVIASAEGIASTSHVFTAPTVTQGAFYDIGVVHQSKNHGASAESVKRRIKIKMTRYGEILYDTGGKPAAVIVGSRASNGLEPWEIRGKQVWIAVALAAKRPGSISWDLSTSNSNSPDIPTIEGPSIAWKLADSNTGPDGSGSFVSSLSSETNMDGSFNYSQPIKDSKMITAAILSYNANYPAAKFVRQIVLKDLGAMDFTRIEVLMRIYQMRHEIDALDPTLSANPGKALSRWVFITSSMAWSSSELTGTGALIIKDDGSVVGGDKKYANGIVPVLEIPA